MSQDLTGVAVGSTYVLSFYYDQPHFFSATACTLTVTYGTAPVGVVVTTERSAVLTAQTMSFVPLVAQGTLRFEVSCEGDDDVDFNVYNVIDQVVLQHNGGSQC